MATATGLTIEDFERLPNALARNHELVDGELVDVSGNNPQHNLFRGFLESLLRTHVSAQRLGIVISEQEFDFAGNAYAPDVSFIRESKRPLLDLKLRVQRFVPDLAIEVVSPNDVFEKLVRRAQRFRDCGTEEAWIFSLENRQAFLYSEKRLAILDENAEFSPGPIPGLTVRIADLLNQYY